jgi:hypothetical protein
MAAERIEKQSSMIAICAGASGCSVARDAADFAHSRIGSIAAASLRFHGKRLCNPS